MPRLINDSLSLLMLLTACSFDAKGVVAGDDGNGGASTQDPGDGGGDTQTSPTTGSGTSTTSGDSEGGQCTPGSSAPCDCSGGGSGTRECAADGSYGACDCPAVTATEVTTEVTTGADSTDTQTTGPTTSATTTTGETTEEGTTGTSSGDESTSTTGMEMCKDDGPEPNESENLPTSQNEQDCSDGQDSFKGTLAGADDIDFHKYFGHFVDNCGGADPTVITHLKAQEPMRMCVYYKCTQGGKVVFDCDGEEMDAKSPTSMMPGCCITGKDYKMQMVVECEGTGDETFDVFIALDQAADACVDYTVEFSYDN